MRNAVITLYWLVGLCRLRSLRSWPRGSGVAPAPFQTEPCLSESVQQGVEDPLPQLCNGERRTAEQPESKDIMSWRSGWEGSHSQQELLCLAHDRKVPDSMI